MRPRDIHDIFGQVLSQATGNFFDMGGGGAMALELLKFKGEWVVTRSSTDFSGSQGGKYFDVDKLTAARVARYSCQQQAVVPAEPAVTDKATSDGGQSDADAKDDQGQ